MYIVTTPYGCREAPMPINERQVAPVARALETLRAGFLFAEEDHSVRANMTGASFSAISLMPSYSSSTDCAGASLGANSARNAL